MIGSSPRAMRKGGFFIGCSCANSKCVVLTHFLETDTSLIRARWIPVIGFFHGRRPQFHRHSNLLVNLFQPRLLISPPVASQYLNRQIACPSYRFNQAKPINRCSLFLSLQPQILLIHLLWIYQRVLGRSLYQLLLQNQKIPFPRVQHQHQLYLEEDDQFLP